MLSNEQKEELKQKIHSIQQEINQLKSELNKLGAGTEQAFLQAKTVHNQIGSQIHKIRDLKNKRNSLTNQVKELKKKRDELNASINPKFDELKKLDKEKKEALKKSGVKGDPSRIKKEIDAMQYKIETEGLTFDKEKKMMKIINEKKKELDQFKAVNAVADKFHKLSKELNELKKQGNSIHKDIQAKAAESQKYHEEVLKLSKEIDTSRGKEKETKEGFSEEQKKFHEINDKLKEKLHEMTRLQGQIGFDKKEEVKSKQERINITLREKEKLVDEKIKKGGKLTTQDLLVFQGKK